MSVFSDDDLKRLKEDLRINFATFWVLNREQTISLLARLEAAEHALEMRHVRGVFEVSIEAWRKAAGK